MLPGWPGKRDEFLSAFICEDFITLARIETKISILKIFFETYYLLTLLLLK